LTLIVLFICRTLSTRQGKKKTFQANYSFGLFSVWVLFDSLFLGFLKKAFGASLVVNFEGKKIMQ